MQTNQPIHVHIAPTPKNAMQSGRAKQNVWVIQPDPQSPRVPEPLMGWVSASDTLTTLGGKLKFASLAEAERFAQAKGWAYTVIAEQPRKIVPRNYVQNFKYEAVE